MNHNMRKRYSEEQVVELIKQAISDEYIKVGTKWFSHYVKFKDINGDNIIFSFLSPHNDEITSFAELSDYLSDDATILIKGVDSDDTGRLPNCFKILQVIPGEFRCYYLFDTSPFVSYAVIEFDEIVTHLITPL